ILLINHRATGKTILKVKMLLPDFPCGDKKLLDEWVKAQNFYMMMLSVNTPGDSVFSYIDRQSIQRLQNNKSSSNEFAVSDRTRDRPQADLYSVTTGALAIQESLQLDVMTQSSGKLSPNTIPIEKLNGPQIKSHPFSEMLKGREPKFFPMSGLIPEEFYYFHFSDINKEIEFSDLLDQWGTSLLNTMQVSSHDADIKGKYLTQLCIRISILTRLFGDKVIDDLAIAGNDPFIHEGTDLSVIFNVKNKKIFDMNMNKYIDETKKNFKDIQEKDISYGQYTIHVVTTPDKTVSCYSCYLNDFKIYSNSQKAIELIIDTYNKKHPSLANALDFLYMRTIFPGNKSDEDAFLYLSESNIRKLVSPKWKIARQRRMKCNNILKMINNAVTLYYMENNKEKPTLERLLANHYLESEYLSCPDEGSYSLNTDTLEPLCSIHGKLRYLTPIAELPITMVSESEQKDYERFVQTYNSFWSQFFDPIGIRAKFNNNTIKIETCILPLIENSIYNNVKNFAGKEPVSVEMPKTPNTILQLLSKFNFADKSLNEYKIKMVKRTSLTFDEFNNLWGDNFSLNFVDSDIMFSLDIAKGMPMLGFLGRDWTGFLFGTFAISSLQMPTYVTFSVKDEIKVSQFIHEYFHSLSKEYMYKSRGRDDWFSINSYEASPDYKGHKIETLNLNLFVVNLRLHVMVYNNNLIISNQLDVLTKLIDNPKELTKMDTNLSLIINADSFNQIKNTVRLGWEERMRKVCINNLGSIYALNQYRKIPFKEIKESSLAINGYYPFCPSGGEYKYNKDTDTIFCTVHGDLMHPKQPIDFNLKIPLNKFINSIQKTETSLKFTPEGIMTSVIIEKNK
ncbi:MAG: hypothetical protein HY934_10890, partial [Candidatus Firestonebacteria bacterium]|nr:hypothetical protein [Candidatus Firestonebacteria bacterium]